MKQTVLMVVLAASLLSPGCLNVVNEETSPVSESSLKVNGQAMGEALAMSLNGDGALIYSVVSNASLTLLFEASYQSGPRADVLVIVASEGRQLFPLGAPYLPRANSGDSVAARSDEVNATAVANVVEVAAPARVSVLWFGQSGAQLTWRASAVAAVSPVACAPTVSVWLREDFAATPGADVAGADALIDEVTATMTKALVVLHAFGYEGEVVFGGDNEVVRPLHVAVQLWAADVVGLERIAMRAAGGLEPGLRIVAAELGPCA